MSKQDSAVQFATATRPHIALGTRDLAASTAFYAALFAQAPTKAKPDYVKFEVAEPPLNLTLNLTDDVAVPSGLEHFGIQVKSSAEVQARADQMRSAGHAGAAEEAVTCCYAVQDKVWVQDPEGRRWELFVVLEAESDVHSKASAAPASKDLDGAPEDACCPPTCCA